MNTHVALLRGINVGGHGILPMKELRALLEDLGLANVKTYLQSGNAVFQCRAKDARRLERKIGKAIRESRGFAPGILVLSLAELRSAVEANPFPAGEDDPKTLHLFFLKSRPENPDLARLESLRARSEEFKLTESVFYLHAPEGIGRSKLAVKVEKALGVPGTGRNWRSVCASLAMARESADNSPNPEGKQ